jgi:hypothetical protein
VRNERNWYSIEDIYDHVTGFYLGDVLLEDLEAKLEERFGVLRDREDKETEWFLSEEELESIGMELAYENGDLIY